ncbi:MAG: hypothetical protein RBU29_03485 [bacterium]|jgi:hypothetical protein|nr:hypothetical protein [bacterium]
MKFRFSLLLVGLMFSAGLLQAQSQPSSVHVYGATDSIQRIDAHAVYFVPNGSRPLPDWQDRIHYLMERTKSFHQREWAGQSTLNFTLFQEPFISKTKQGQFPSDDPNNFFWAIINEVWHSGKIEFDPSALPILVVFSDNNFSPGYDDWTRECNGVGCPFPAPHSKCAGYVLANGEDRPGSRAGGSRSVFWPEMHIGLGLVTADGWRVPVKGSDCVVYHEGLGHSLGLPHPEPIDNSVMGLAQYIDSIQITWIDKNQKLVMGWQETEIQKNDLFSNFTISHSPTPPVLGEPLTLIAEFPGPQVPRSIMAEYQTNLWDPFQSLGKPAFGIAKDHYIATWTLPAHVHGRCFAYRITVESQDGQTEQIWNYAKIRE